MRSIVCIPCLYDGQTCLKAFRSVIAESDILILNNGGDRSVQQAIDLFKGEQHTNRVSVFKSETNMYVTWAWNFFMQYFIKTDFYDQLVIMNSDLILHPGWSSNLVDGISCIPCDGELKEDRIVFEGTPGVAIHLNREMAKLVYPIPQSIKIWFNDQYIFTKLRKAGYKTIVKANYIATHWHNGSQTCQKLPEFQTIIEQDKLAWLEIEKTL